MSSVGWACDFDLDVAAGVLEEVAVGSCGSSSYQVGSDPMGLENFCVDSRTSPKNASAVLFLVVAGVGDFCCCFFHCLHSSSDHSRLDIPLAATGFASTPKSFECTMAADS